MSRKSEQLLSMEIMITICMRGSSERSCPQQEHERLKINTEAFLKVDWSPGSITVFKATSCSYYKGEVDK